METRLLTDGLCLKIVKISLLQCFLMILGAGLAYASTARAQELLERRLTLNAQDEQIKVILTKIEKDAQVRFMYSPDAIQAHRRTSLNVTNQPLRAVLELLLKPLSVGYRVAGGRIVLSTLAEGNVPQGEESGRRPTQRNISGVVTDDTGAGLPGVSILVRGSQTGTTTDIKGAFQLAVPDSAAVLVFSFVGYKTQEVAVGNMSMIPVTLKPDLKALEEVVVVGYGAQSRRNVTGSVSKVNMKTVENLPTTNVSQALRGRVAGVQFIDNGRPGQGGSILVRGQRSISAANNPLIVVDGIFFNGSLADINPNDIESMEVLKDASAAAIYGSRAANGVLLITSKMGKTEKPTVRFNTYFGISDWSYKMKLLSPERYIQKTLDLRSQTGQDADPAKIESYLASSEAQNYLAGKTIDPWKEISQDAGVQSYDMSLSGRSSKTSYYLSASYVKEKGLIYNDNSKRTSFRVNVDNQIMDWLKVGVNSTYISRDLSGQEASVYNAYMTSPYGKLYYDEAKTQPTQFPVPEDQLIGNPMMSLLNRNEEINQNLFANFFALVDIPYLPGLSYRLNFSPNLRWSHNYNFTRQDINRPLVNTTSASKVNRQDYDWVVENIITYNRQIGENNAIDVTLLYGRNHSGWESTTASASPLASDALDWNNLNLGQVQVSRSDGAASDGISSMARFNYRLKGRYLATFTVRRDGSSVFAANNKYATFPSGALAWVASEEPFLKQVSAIDLLKLRVSFGSVGNQAISPYQSLALSATNQYVFGDGGATSTGIFTSNMANSNLKWETTLSSNIALDFELLKGRIGGSVEYYNMDTRDLILARALPTTTGFKSVLTNLGATNNKGFELTLNTVNFRRGSFEWNSNLVFSTNKNKIVHIYASDTNGDGREDDDLGNRWFIGKPISVAYDYVFDGIYQEGESLPNASYKPGWVRVKDLNGDGKFDAAGDRAIVGQLQPKIRWGVTNNFRYGNVNLSVFVNAMQGWIQSLSVLDIRNAPTGAGNYPERPANMIDAGWWTPENKSATRPAMSYTNPLGHNYYMSRNFIRVQDVSLSYDFPKQLCGKLRVGSLRLYASGRNLLTFTKWLGPDPESGYNSQSNFYPTPRTVTMGLNLSF
ncbi:SusC/RagA family TonB-linked outer membrane protein [Dyadobacter beijingensis]|uniref:SusC/RagA family TonB-linked outer membrane protein n=1 Tax=Dyadobacter beijingensis TaxID=365489 RepID=A0ABQ2HWM7_9BACT|nr:TonB-dependent receptor [Dyadobacter beijingensis]GGM90354.1 SusC/RagA family TonB-linked outer membrane protein [Dyadobacter beijingensis]